MTPQDPTVTVLKQSHFFLWVFLFFIPFFLSAEPRIISLAPDITETLFALDLGHLLVGTVEESDYPAAASKIITIGSFIQPNKEVILRLKPNLILCRKEALSISFHSWLQRQKIHFVLLPGSTEDDIFFTINTLGNILNKKNRALHLVRTLKQKLSLPQGKRKKNPLQVLIHIEENPLMIAGKNTLPHRALILAGVLNAGAHYTGYPKLQRETVLKLNPDIILFPLSAHEKKRTQTTIDLWKKWTSLSAVKHHALYTIDADLVSRASPRFFDGVTLLSKMFESYER